MAEVHEALDSSLLTTYPVRDELHRQLCEKLRQDEDRVLVTPGSDAATKALYHAYVRPGDRVVMLAPSYAMYAVYARMFGAEAVQVDFDRDLSIDAGRLIESIVPGTRLVLLANPNQPTGTLLAENVLDDLLEAAAEAGAVVAIDEAYYPFSHTTVLPLLDDHPNLVMLRSFSKAAGLAGLRIGFIAADAGVVGNLFKVRSANDVNSVAILCAGLILKHPEVVDDYVAEVEEGARVLEEGVRSLGLAPLPTHANFMLVGVADRRPPGSLVEDLRDKGYLVKGPIEAPCLADCIRVTLGPAAIMSDFVRVLGEAVEAGGEVHRS